MADRRIALEVDGDQVTVVERTGDVAVSVATVNAGALPDSVAVALKGFRQRRTDPPLPVAVVPPLSMSASADVSADSWDDVDVRASAAAEALPDGASFATSRRTDPPPPGRAAGMLAVTLPSRTARQVFEAFGPVRIELLPSSLALPPVDGLFLGVHMSASELTLRSGGRTVATVQLPSGGLSRLAAVISPEDVFAGLREVAAFLDEPEASSPVLRSEAGRFFRDLARETVSASSRLAASAGVPAPTSVVCCGVGASSPLLDAALADAGLAAADPSALTEALMYLRPRLRRPALVALGVGLARPDETLDPVPVPAEMVAAAAERSDRRRAAVLLAAAMVPAVAAAAAAVWMGSFRADAASALAAAESSYAALPPYAASASDAASVLESAEAVRASSAASAAAGVVDVISASAFQLLSGRVEPGGTLVLAGPEDALSRITGLSDAVAALPGFAGVRLERMEAADRLPSSLTLEVRVRLLEEVRG